MNCSTVPLAFVGFLLLCMTSIKCDSISDIHSDPASSLRELLTNFSSTRNHLMNPEGKNKARDFIKKSYEDSGLHVWIENARISDSLSGENIVGLLKSKRTGTAEDEVVIVGAHYDTVPNTAGVDDNGSGVTALIEVAKQIGNAKCKLRNTIMFVAFDFEEWTEECNVSWPITCGSRQFVKNLTRYLQGTGGTVSGALVLETILNHNSSAGSQMLPSGIERVLPEFAKEVKNDASRGNFLAVIGRKEPDKKLLSLIEKHYQNDSNYRAQLLKIPLVGKPSEAPQFEPFYRSDHYQFWENNVSFSALMLTDTADFRGYMHKCYHHLCDNLLLVKDDDLEFLRRTINAAINTTLELSHADSCNSKDIYSASITISLNLALLAMATCSVFFATII